MIPTVRRLKQEDCEFEITLGYRESKKEQERLSILS